MRALSCLAFLLLSFAGHAEEESPMLSHAEKAAITAEVKQEIDGLIEGCEQLDMERAFAIFSREPGFYVIAGDGKAYDFPTFYDNNKQYLGACSRFELETSKLDIKVLTRELVVVSWLYKATATYSSGAQDVIEHAGATFVLQKSNGKWVAISYQESNAAPVRIE